MKKIFFCLLASAAVIVLVSGCGKEKKKKGEREIPPMAVESAAAYQGKIRKVYRMVGYVKPMRSVRLVARVDGFLRERNFKEGAFVKKGELLYLIDPVPYQLALDKSRAELARAEAEALNASLEFARSKSLYEEKITASKTFDRARAALDSANASVRAAKAALGLAELNLSYTRVVAPFDGWVGLTKVDVGNYIAGPERELTSLLEIEPVRVEFHLSDAYLSGELLRRLGTGTPPADPVRLVLPQNNPHAETGQIHFWENKISSSTATLTLQALFPNRDRKLLPGMYVSVEMDAPKPQDVLLIDRRVLQFNQNKSFVYILTPGDVLAFRPVVIGESHADEAMIVSGMKAGERAVFAGNPMLRPGMRVRAAPPGGGANR